MSRAREIADLLSTRISPTDCQVIADKITDAIFEESKAQAEQTRAAVLVVLQSEAPEMTLASWGKVEKAIEDGRTKK